MLRTCALLSALLVLAPRVVSASYGFYVGKDLTADGSVLLGGTGEEVSSHWLEVIPRREHPPGATITVGVTEKANIPGELIEIPQVRRTAKYIAMFYSDYLGFPPPLTNGGLNEHHVAVRDIWSPSRRELVEMTPRPQRGVNYSDLARVVLERARSAREGVEIIGDLIAEHGYATYGGNSHLIADEEEGWVVIELAGGAGLWAAERLGPKDVRVSYPGYIGEIPKNYLEHPDYMGSPNLISFAVEQGWYDPDAGEPFNLHDVYGAQDRKMRDHDIKFVNSKTLEEDLEKLAPEIRVQDVIAAVRDVRIADDEAGYGQVAHIRPGVRPELGVLWVAPTGSVTAPFIPYHIGIESVPPEYRQHRYLTKDAGRTFLSTDYQAQEATEFAGRVFKRLMYYTCERPEKFLPEVTEALQAFEARRIAEQPRIEREALLLYRQGEQELAADVLTRYSENQAMEALRLGKALLGSIEARTRVLYGIREPETGEINEPATAGRETVTCRSSVDRDGPVVSAEETPARHPEIVAASTPAPPSPARVGERRPPPWLLTAGALLLGVGLGLLGALLLRRRRR